MNLIWKGCGSIRTKQWKAGYIGFISLIITSYIDNGRQKPIFIIFTKQTIGELEKLCLIQFENGKQVLTELTSNHKAISKRLI